MFVSEDYFARQFEPFGEDYLYFPTKRSGGRLVTAAEHQQLVDSWRATAGSGGIWKLTGIGVAVLFVWVFTEDYFHPPEWTNDALIWFLVAAISARFAWAAGAPRRLVRGRTEVAPPRTLAESRRVINSMIPWQLIALVVVAAGNVFFDTLWEQDKSVQDWLVTLISGGFFAVYSWIGIQKYRERS